MKRLVLVLILALFFVGGSAGSVLAIAQFSVLNNALELDCLVQADGEGNLISNGAFYGGTLELVQIPQSELGAPAGAPAGSSPRTQHQELVGAMILTNLLLMTDAAHCTSGLEPLPTFALLATGAILLTMPEVAVYDTVGTLVGVYFVSLVYHTLAYQGFPLLAFAQALDTGLTSPTISAARLLLTAAMCIAVTHFTTTSLLGLNMDTGGTPAGTLMKVAVGLGAALTLHTLLNIYVWQTEGPNEAFLTVPIFTYALYHALVVSMRHPAGWLYAFAAPFYQTRMVNASEPTCR